jgi:pSer/pThr/pTyr-binding forkhead associated (FHA) protein
MAKLVVLSEALKGRSHELTVEKTTVGRLDDNLLQLAEGSVSSHHCEISLRGSDVFVKDLNSTNGTYINGQQVKTEAQLKPGQILRLGQLELRLENGQTPSSPSKKVQDKTLGTQGVRFDSDQGTKPVAFTKDSPFAKKSNKGTKVFIAVAVVLAVVVVGLIVWSFSQVK